MSRSHVARVSAALGRGIQRLLLQAIRLYQATLSRSFPPACRFVPSCSEYAHEAIARHGVLRGGWLGLKRLARCQPRGPVGYDPVPSLREVT